MSPRANCSALSRHALSSRSKKPRPTARRRSRQRWRPALASARSSPAGKREIGIAAGAPKSRGLRLPQWHEAPTPGKMKFLQTLVGEPFRVVFGEITAARLMALDPTVPLRAFVGHMLEVAGG